MVVLVRNVIDILRRGERPCSQVSPRLRRIEAERQVVEPHIAACDLADNHLIGGLQFTGQRKGLRGHSSPTVLVGRRYDTHGARLLAVDRYLSRAGRIERHDHRQRAMRSWGSRQLVGTGNAYAKEAAVVEVAATMIPRIVVDLGKRVVIDLGGIAGGLECCFINSQCRRIVLGQEVVAVIAIGIASTGYRRSTTPPYWAYSIEQPLAARRTGRHLLQVVGSCQVVGRQFLGLHGTAVAVDFHLIYISKACLPHQSLCQLIHSRRRHPDFSPAAGGEDGMGGISMTRLIRQKSPTAIGGTCGLDA